MENNTMENKVELRGAIFQMRKPQVEIKNPNKKDKQQLQKVRELFPRLQKDKIGVEESDEI